MVPFQTDTYRMPERGSGSDRQHACLVTECSSSEQKYRRLYCAIDQVVAFRASSLSSLLIDSTSSCDLNDDGNCFRRHADSRRGRPNCTPTVELTASKCVPERTLRIRLDSSNFVVIATEPSPSVPVDTRITLASLLLASHLLIVHSMLILHSMFIVIAY